MGAAGQQAGSCRGGVHPELPGPEPGGVLPWKPPRSKVWRAKSDNFLEAKQSQSNRSEPELSDASQRNELTWQLSYDNDSLRPEFAGDTCAPGRHLRHQGHLMRTRVVWLAISSEIPLPWL
jgi:hypothetical protein